MFISLKYLACIINICVQFAAGDKRKDGRSKIEIRPLCKNIILTKCLQEIEFHGINSQNLVFTLLAANV